MRSGDSFYTAAFAATTAAFTLQGGGYILAFVKVGSQSAKLQALGPDGTTWLDMMTALAASSVSALLYCPPGQYRIVASTTDISAVALTRVPVE